MNSHPVRVSPFQLRRGFTLIELLTVIAIIGILAAIIIPVVGKVRTTAKRSQGVSNMRQIMMASLSFMNDNKGNWMYGIEQVAKGDVAHTNNWYPRVITRYLTSQQGNRLHEVFQDPLLPSSPGTIQIGVNRALFRGTYSDTSSVGTAFNLNRIKTPSRLAMFVDNWQNKDTGNGGYGDIQNTGTSMWSWPGAWNDTYTPTEAMGNTLPPQDLANFGNQGGHIDLNRDPGQAKLGFMDGHVAVVKKDQLFHRLFDPRFN